jgi:hypothetical protein
MALEKRYLRLDFAIRFSVWHTDEQVPLNFNRMPVDCAASI